MYSKIRITKPGKYSGTIAFETETGKPIIFVRGGHYTDEEVIDHAKRIEILWNSFLNIGTDELANFIQNNHTSFILNKEF